MEANDENREKETEKNAPEADHAGTDPQAAAEAYLNMLYKVQHNAKLLDELTRVLNMMLALAELSSSDMNLDRAALQKMLDSLLQDVDRLGSLF